MKKLIIIAILLFASQAWGAEQSAIIYIDQYGNTVAEGTLPQLKAIADVRKGKQENCHWKIMEITPGVANYVLEKNPEYEPFGAAQKHDGLIFIYLKKWVCE